jgi:IS605 OrfB family transposase
MIEIFQSVTGVLMVGETEGHTDKVFYEIKTPRVIQIQQVGNGMVKVNFAPLLGNPKAVFIVLDKIVFNYEPDAELIQKYREAVSALATLSTGEKIVGPKAHKALLNRQRRLSRSLSRKVESAKVNVGLQPKQPIPKGIKIPLSRNSTKVRTRLSKLHARIANIRNDSMHKLTTELVNRFALIGIENLNVSGMIKNRNLARNISDMSFFEFKRQLRYKADLYGSIIVEADQ